MEQQGPPYAPTTASLGGLPTVEPDVAVTSVFLFLFVIGAVAHMTILQLNLRKGHKFLMSGLMFGFCMARITACVLRIVWATRPTNISLAIAASVFVAAGVVILYIVNAIFAQRILRAHHPNAGWHQAIHHTFLAIYALIIISLVMLITVTVQSFFTLDTNARRIDRDIQLYGQTLFAVVSFFPIFLVSLSLVTPRTTRVEKFGSGHFKSKIAILLFAAVLLCLGATFRVGTNFLTPRPSNDPAWYHSKACFYIFNFSIEIIVIWLYILVRVDRRFHVPNGSKGRGDYSRSNGQKEITGMEAPIGSRETRILSEEEVFDDEPVHENKIPSGQDKEKSFV